MNVAFRVYIYIRPVYLGVLSPAPIILPHFSVCRFTSFLAGKAHISAQEQVDYEWNEAGLDSTSESEADEDNVPPHARVNSPHR